MFLTFNSSVKDDVVVVNTDNIKYMVKLNEDVTLIVFDDKCNIGVKCNITEIVSAINKEK